MNESINVTNAEKCALDEKTIGRPASGQNLARSPLVAVSTAAASSASRSTAASRSPSRQPPAPSDSKEGAAAAARRASTLPPQPKPPSSLSVSVPGRSSVPVVESGCPAASHSPVSSSTTTSSSTTVLHAAAQPPPSKSAHASATSTAAPTSAGSHSATSSSANSSHGCSTARSRRIVNFTASAFKALRLKRLALYNPKLLRKYGITSVQIRNTSNAEASQRFELPKNCSPSPPPPPAKHRPPPQATAFTPIAPTVIGAPSSFVRAPAARASKSKLAMEQRAVAQQQQISRMPPNMPPHQQSGMPPMQQGRMEQMMQEPGTSGNCNDTSLLSNLLSNNNANQMNASGNGMPPQPHTPVHQQPMNPNMMRYAQHPNAPQQMPPQHSPMYPGAQQSPHYMQGNAMQGRMMAGHPMGAMNQQMMMQQGGQPMAPPQQQMQPAASQSAEPSPKKRKRMTKKQKEAEEAAKKQQQQQQQQAAAGQMQHPNQHYAQQMWPQEYAMHQQAGQQRVPPVNMHVAPAQYRMPYGNYMHYQQQNSMMSGGAPPQYPNQHYMQQQGWHPNMQQQHMGQYAQQQQPPQYPSQTPQNVHYPPQQSPAPDMKGHRMAPPGYNQQFMSPPPQHPNSNYQMQQAGQNAQQQQQQMAAMQQQSQAQQNQLHQRVGGYDIADNVDDLVATLSSEADDFDLDSIELEPMRNEGEMGGPPNAQHMGQNQHPGAQQNAHWGHYNDGTAPPNYPMQQGGPQGYYSGQQPQAQQQAMPPVYPGNAHGQMPPVQQQQHPNANFPPMQGFQQQQQMQQQQQLREVQSREAQQKNREIQDKKEREQLEQAMQKSPSAPPTPSAEPVPEAQQRSIANTIDSVFEKVMSGWSEEGSSSGAQPTPAPAAGAKRKKQSAKAVAQQQEQPTPPPPQHPMYSQQQHPGTPTGFTSGYGGPPTPQQQQQFFYQQQQQRMQQQRQAMGNGGPPVSTPDGFYHGQPMGGHPNGPHNGAHTPQRSNSMKNVLAGGSNPHTPQTPQTAPPTAMSHPLAQPPSMQPQMFNENGGSSASSTAATPVQRGNSDETPIGIKEEAPQSAPPHSFPQQSPYAQFNGHAAPNQHFSFHPNDEGKIANAVNPAVSNAVSLKSHIVDSNADLCTPPSANAMSSATPTTASQQDHGDGGLKSEVNDVKRDLLERNESEQIVQNGPTNNATTSAVAE